MVWYGMVWYGMVWYGMVWYGMVWYGMYDAPVVEARRALYGWYATAFTQSSPSFLQDTSSNVVASYIRILKEIKS